MSCAFLAPPAGLPLSRLTAFGEDAKGNVCAMDDLNGATPSTGEVYRLRLRPVDCVSGNYDLNGDGQIDVLDIQLAAGDWQRPDFVPDYDVNCTGGVDIVEVESVAVAWQD